MFFVNTENDESKDAEGDEHVSRREFNRFRRDVAAGFFMVLIVAGLPHFISNIGRGMAIVFAASLVAVLVWAGRGFK